MLTRITGSALQALLEALLAARHTSAMVHSRGGESVTMTLHRFRKSELPLMLVVRTRTTSTHIPKVIHNQTTAYGIHHTNSTVIEIDAGTTTSYDLGEQPVASPAILHRRLLRLWKHVHRRVRNRKPPKGIVPEKQLETLAKLAQNL